MLKIDYNTITPKEAVALQRELQQLVRLSPIKKSINTIAGADISFNRFSPIVYAGIVVLSFPELKLIEEVTVVTKTSFPYVPGLLAFREIPAIIEAWNKLKKKPDILVCDGHGIAHPRRLGIATHFGIVSDTITIGCAKSILCGDCNEPSNEKTATAELIHKEEKIGVALRTKKNCKPVYISPGNKITLNESVNIMKQCVGKYRIPEPTRLAHLLVNKIRKEHNQRLTADKNCCTIPTR